MVGSIHFIIATHTLVFATTLIFAFTLVFAFFGKISFTAVCRLFVVKVSYYFASTTPRNAASKLRLH
jgi:hypothetical protein